MRKKFKPVLFIGLDVAEPALIEQWTSDGTLPNLKHLYERGAYGLMGFPGDLKYGLPRQGLPWPTFYTGTNPGRHGAYHYIQWQPDRMRVTRLHEGWLPLIPFWRRIPPDGPRTIVIDMPDTTAPARFKGIELAGWSPEEAIIPFSAYPKTVSRWAKKNFGPLPEFVEQYGVLDGKTLLLIGRKLIRAAEQTGGLAAALMETEPWDLFMVVFTSIHRAGHKLRSGLGMHPGEPESLHAELAQSLKDIYVACDRQIGRLVKAANKDTTVMVGSLHSMGINTSRVELLPKMVEAILSHHVDAGKAFSGGIEWSSRLRGLIPQRWRFEIKRRMPFSWQDALTAYWRMSRFNYDSPIFFLPGDHGHLQVNLRGREARGVVSPGAEYEKWIRIMIEGLKSFKDIDTREPVVEHVLRREELWISGERVELFPDLTVHWTETCSALNRALVSDRYGTVLSPTPGLHPDGRVGNHCTNGFLLSAGDRFPAGGKFKDGNILDLAPTILDLFGLPRFPEMEGRVLKVA